MLKEKRGPNILYGLDKEEQQAIDISDYLKQIDIENVFPENMYKDLFNYDKISLKFEGVISFLFTKCMTMITCGNRSKRLTNLKKNSKKVLLQTDSAAPRLLRSIRRKLMIWAKNSSLAKRKRNLEMLEDCWIKWVN